MFGLQRNDHQIFLDGETCSDLKLQERRAHRATHDYTDSIAGRHSIFAKRLPTIEIDVSSTDEQVVFFSPVRGDIFIAHGVSRGEHDTLNVLSPVRGERLSTLNCLSPLTGLLDFI
jgi:hypothetical protein